MGKQLPAKGAWSGSSAWLVGGGTSLRGFNWNLLRNKDIIVCVNMAFSEVPWAQMVFTEDFRFLERVAASEELREAWDDFQGLKVFNCLAPSFRERALELFPDLIFIDRKREDKYWATDWSDGLALTSNSAIGAANVLDILGVDAIYLLGMDCRSNAQGENNYHAGRYPTGGEWETGTHQYISFASDWKHWAAIHLRAHGRRVVNVINPELPSALDCFETATFDEVFS